MLSPCPHTARHSQVHEGLHIEMTDQVEPGQVVGQAGVLHLGVNVPHRDVTNDVEATFLHSVDKLYQRAGRGGIINQQQHLRSPELDVLLPNVQQQQIFSHLMEDQGLSFKSIIFA